MNITRLVFGLLLAAAPGLLLGATAQGAQFSTAPRKDAPSDKRRGSAPDGPMVDSARRGGLEDAVQIMGVTEQKPDASGRRKVTVRVQYALVHYPKGILTLGFNLKSATHFARVTDQSVMAGTEEIELSATIVPVTWPDGLPFKLYVSLSAEPRPGEWSLLAAVSQVMKPAKAPAAK